MSLDGEFVMSVKEIRALVRRSIEEYNKGKTDAMAVMDELYTTNFVMHGDGEEIRGIKNLKQSMSEAFSAFPDAHYTIDDMVVEGDKVATRLTVTGTHKGEFMGIPPTNKKVKVWAMTIYRVSGGKFVESWEMADTMSMMQQLGVILTPKTAK
jgi:steroid delta-isomerase-like uncharacterized protein